MPDMLKSSVAMEESNYLLGKADEAPAAVKLKPNPAKDYIIIEYELEMQTDAKIEIYDISGNLKYAQDLTELKDQFTVDTRNWKPGIYITSLKVNGKLVESDKFTIID